uniref:Heavy metal-translocating P-type ATPase n=1 Tax=Phlebotomus kandelakii TaxID=1109342 RepID=A0A6B2EMR6_9DIPT
MIVKSLLGVFLVILLVSVTEQAPWSDEDHDRPALSERVEEFLNNLNRDGLDDSEKIKYLGEILIALSYYKYKDPNKLQHCAGQKIVQDGYRDIQRQPYDEDEEYHYESSDSHDRGVDGHKRNHEDYDYSHLEEYDDEDRHHVINGDEEEHEMAAGHPQTDEDEEDDYSHGYSHDYDEGEDEDERESYSRGGGDAGYHRRGSQEQSYDPHSGQRAPGYSDPSEYEHSGDYDNSHYQQYSSTPSTTNKIDYYLNQIQLHSVPADLAQYAESYLKHSKDSIRYYASHAKDFEKIRPCLENVMKYFNILNDDLAKEYIRCQRQCYLDRLTSYTSAISQYTVTTNACINSRMH